MEFSNVMTQFRSFNMSSLASDVHSRNSVYQNGFPIKVIQVVQQDRMTKKTTCHYYN